MAALQPPRLSTSCEWTLINAKAEVLKTAFCQDVLTKSTNADTALLDITRIVHSAGMQMYLYQASSHEVAIVSGEVVPTDCRETYDLVRLYPDGVHRKVVATVSKGTVTLKEVLSNRFEVFALRKVMVVAHRDTLILTHKSSLLRSSARKYTCDGEAAAFAATLESRMQNRPKKPALTVRLRTVWKTYEGCFTRRVLAQLVLSPVPYVPQDNGGQRSPPAQLSDDNVVKASTKVKHCLVRFWGEDIARGANHRDPLGFDDVVYMNMVDFYLSPEDWACKVCLGQPVVLRTLDITEPCGEDGHRRWRFDENRLIYNIFYNSQGQKIEKTFEHELWHWTSGDVLEIGDYIYTVRVRKVAKDDDIKFVLLTPVARKPSTPVQVTLGWMGVNPRFVHSDAYKGFWNTVIKSQLVAFCSWRVLNAEVVRTELTSIPMRSDGVRPSFHDVFEAWTHWLLKHKADSLASHALGRVNVSVSTPKGIGYSVMCTFESGDGFDKRRREALADGAPQLKARDQERSLVLVSVAGAFEYHTYTQTQWSEARSVARLGPTDCKDAWGIRNASDRLFLLNIVAGIAGVDVATRQKFLVWTYGHLDTVPDSKDLRSAQCLGDPWMGPTLAPMDTWQNEQQGIHARVLTQMGGPEKTIDVALMGSIREFVDLCLIHMGGLEGSLQPDGNDETLERMGTPRQRESIVRSILDEFKGDHVMRPFVKMENRDADSRIVSPFAGPGKAKYSALVHALMSKAIEKLPFVLCGRSPSDVEAKVVSICAQAHDLRVVEGDVIRMDGNVHMPQRVCWQGFAVVFEKVVQLHFNEQHMGTIGLESKSTKGVRFCGGVAIPSGVPDTTGNNTMGNGAQLYHAKRLEGYSVLDSWQWLCNCVVVSGDDSLIAQMSPEAVAAGIVAFGHKPKIQARVDTNFTLLGRMYGTVSTVASGIVNNCQDPARVYDRLTLCVGKLYDQRERRKRYFDKACAVLTQDPHSYGISAIAECIVKAGEKHYGWTRFENFDMNYNVNPGRYSNDHCMWFEEVNRKIYPDHDWNGMLSWCAAERTWEEIEKHPDFAPHTETIRKDVTLIVKDCDHTQADFCDLQGNIDKGSDDAVPSVANPHFKEGTSIEVQKKAYKECFVRENKRFDDWSKSNPRPVDYCQSLASLRTIMRDRTSKPGNGDFMEDPSFIEAVKAHAESQFAKTDVAQGGEVAKASPAHDSKREKADASSAPSSSDGALVKLTDTGAGVFAWSFTVAPTISAPTGHAVDTHSGAAMQAASGAAPIAGAVKPPALVAKASVKVAESAPIASAAVKAAEPSPANPPIVAAKTPEKAVRVVSPRERFVSAKLLEQLDEKKKRVQRLKITLQYAKAKQLTSGKSSGEAAVEKVTRLKHAKGPTAGASAGREVQQSSAEEVQVVEVAKPPPPVEGVVAARLQLPVGSPPASLPASPPSSEASLSESSDSSWDCVFDHRSPPLEHWKLARYFDYQAHQYRSKDVGFPGTVEHLIGLLCDNACRDLSGKTRQRIMRWIGGWDPYAYPDYTVWEPLHRAAADAEIERRDLAKKEKKARKALKKDLGLSGAVDLVGEPEAWVQRASAYFSGSAAGASTDVFTAAVVTTAVPPTEATISAVQGKAKAEPPASEQERKKKRKHRKRRAGDGPVATSSDDQDDEKNAKERVLLDIRNSSNKQVVAAEAANAWIVQGTRRGNLVLSQQRMTEEVLMGTSASVAGNSEFFDPAAADDLDDEDLPDGHHMKLEPGGRSDDWSGEY